MSALRPYAQILPLLSSAGSREQRMQTVVDRLWEALHPTGVSWVGFYLARGPGELVLGPRRDKPACSPIGLHGVCGRALRERRPVVVRDVRTLGSDYIACDPRDRSEIALPLIEADGRCGGVLDLDSHEVESFGTADVDGLQSVLHAAGLTSARLSAADAILI